jgi:hypothetical protein
MECTVSWTGTKAATGSRSGMTFLAETGSGHTLVMDGAPDADKPENGGANLAPRPMETVRRFPTRVNWGPQRGPHAPWKPCWRARAVAPRMTWC